METITLENLNLPAEELQQALEVYALIQKPPIRVPENIEEASMLLEELGLLSTVQPSDETPVAYAVHRWTATALGRRADPASLREAHRRAAQHWHWRAKALPQSRQQDIEDLLEARYHYYQAGEIDTAVEVTEVICSQLDTWGVWQREEQLCRETLNWLPERSSKSAIFLHQLGIVAQDRGDYDQALEWYRRSLAIDEELGNRAGMAISYGQMGVLLTKQGMAELRSPVYPAKPVHFSGTKTATSSHSPQLASPSTGNTR